MPADKDGKLDALDMQDSAATYRSPPFREARLPEEACLPEPPPVPPSDLYRGRTTVVVEDVDWMKDGRWLGGQGIERFTYSL